MEILGVITIGGAALGALAIAYMMAEALMSVRHDLQQADYTTKSVMPEKCAR